MERSCGRKNKIGLLERPLKMKKYGVFPFVISEISMFSCYANQLSNDVRSGSPKVQMTESTMSLGYITEK